MEKLLTGMAALVLCACAGNTGGTTTDPPATRQARVCVKNDGYALIDVVVRQRDVTSVMLRGIAPGLTECRRVMLGNASTVLFVASDDQRDETIHVGLIRAGNTLSVNVPRLIAHTSVMDFPAEPR